jgi:hypothetical protein
MADPAPTYTPAHADRLRHLADPEGVRILSRESHEARRWGRSSGCGPRSTRSAIWPTVPLTMPRMRPTPWTPCDRSAR